MDNLDRDVKAAMRLGYGVHYGRYKVDYPNTKDDAEEMPLPTKPSKRCPECGMEFVPGRVDQKFCTDDCRNRANMRLRSRRKSIPELPIGPASCAVCGNRFQRYKKHQETCGRNCAARLRNIRRYHPEQEKEETEYEQ